MKNKQRTILCMLIATVFLMPLMGNTVVGSSTAEYHFNSYDISSEAWEKTPNLMVDGDKLYFAGTEIDTRTELCDGNTCGGTDLGEITKVEIRANASYYINQATLILLPVFGSGYGDEHSFEPEEYPYPEYSNWFDITNDTNAPRDWSWSNVSNLDCKVNASKEPGGGPFELHCSILEIRVTYNPS